MEELINLLHTGGYSCTIANGGKIRTFTQRGVADLYDLLTQEPEVPAGSMEQICEFLAEHYKAPSGPAFTQVQAPATAAGETPTKAEYDTLVQKLKDAGIFK